ncbi:MAG: SPOR domain-containing protein [bacterium]|nr:SPOR domain-containing protein [bacterium]
MRFHLMLNISARNLSRLRLLRTISITLFGCVIFAILGFPAFQFESNFGRNMNGAQFVTVAPDGKVWVAAYSDHEIRIYMPDGQEASFSPINSGLDHLGNAVKLENPSGIAIDKQGIIYISDDAMISPKRIYKYNAFGTALPGITLKYSLGDIAISDSGHIFIAEKTGNAFHVLDADGNELEGSPVTIVGSRSMFRGITVTPDGATVYITAENPGEVLKFAGKISGNRVQYQLVGTVASNLSRPGAVELDKEGRIYIAETGADRIKVFSSTGIFETDIVGGTPGFRSPRGIAITPDGTTLYIAQFTNAPLQKWSTGITATSSAAPVTYRVQIAAFSSESKANGIKSQLASLGYSGINIVFDGQYYRVQVGNFNTIDDAVNLANDINARLVSPDFSGCWIMDSNLKAIKSVPITGVTAAQPPGTPIGVGNYWIQIGAYRVESNAQAVKKAIEKLGFTNVVINQEQNYQKVRLGPFPSITTAQRIVAALKDPQRGLVFPGLTGDFWIFAGGAGGAPPPAVTKIVYRVFIASFPDQKEALLQKAKLEAKGFWPVFVEAEEPLYNLLIGAFNSETEAAGLIPKLKAEGYTDLRIVRAGEVRPQIALTPEQEEQKKRELTAIADRAEELFAKKQYDQAILQLERLLQLQADNTKAIQRLQEAHEKLSEESRLVLEEQKRRIAEEEAKRKEVDALNAKAMNLWEQANYLAAVETWNQVLRIDPRDPRATLYIALAKERLAPLPDTKKEELKAKADKTAELDKKYKEARNLYASGAAQSDIDIINQAIEQWQQILREDPNHIEAKEAIANAELKIKEIEQAKKSKLWNWIIYIGAGILIIAGLIFIVPTIMKSILSRERKPKPVKVKAAVVSESAPEPAKVTPAPTKPTVAEKKKGFSLFGGKKKRELEAKLAAEREAKEREEREKAAAKQQEYEKWYQKGLDELEQGKFEDAIASFLQASQIDPNNPDPKRKAEFARKSLKTQQEAEKERQKKTPPAPEPTSTAPPPPTPPPTPTPVPPTEPVVAPSEVTAPITSVSAPTAPGVIFEQDFDSESSGMRPAGWNGEFAYATIQVQNSVRANDTGNALKFEKKEGSGSTHYRCRFPNATGKFTIEFDLCCEKKNKYFLGVYLEADEDFRKAVHTVIHTPEDGTQASLRLQGESVPYQLGKWVHIKYEVDLTNAVVNGYVDGNKVVTAARVPGTPEALNTISIRDNPATVAVLYLDNIKISS